MSAQVRVIIGTESRPLSDAREDWINEQVRRRSAEGAVCVRVKVEGPDIDLVLSTPGCPTGGGGGYRRPTYLESDVLALWEGRGLLERGFSGGNLVAFLSQLRRLVGA